jgi:hypothetical protein
LGERKVPARELARLVGQHLLREPVGLAQHLPWRSGRLVPQGITTPLQNERRTRTGLRQSRSATTLLACLSSELARQETVDNRIGISLLRGNNLTKQLGLLQSEWKPQVGGTMANLQRSSTVRRQKRRMRSKLSAYSVFTVEGLSQRLATLRGRRNAANQQFRRRCAELDIARKLSIECMFEADLAKLIEEYVVGLRANNR